MKFSETEAAVHPILSAPKPVRRKEIALAVGVAILVLAVVGLIIAAVFVDGFGGRLFFGT